MQRLRRSDHVEMTRQERQGFDLADDVPASPQTGRQASHQIDRAIDAEHFMTGIAQHCRESAAARPEVKDPHRLLTDHPRGRSFWIRSSPRRHGGNFSGA
jgi:hypothetical protein